MKEIKEVIIDNEKVNLTHSSLWGWKVVFPMKKDMNKPIRISRWKIDWSNIHWKNFISGGSWIKLGIVIFSVLLILGCIYEYSTALKIANDCLNKTPIYLTLP